MLHQPDVGVDDNEKETTATSQQSSWVLRRNDSSKGRQLGLPSSTSNLIGAGYCDTITFLNREMFACVLSCLCFPLYFVCAAYLAYFSVLFTKIAEAGTKGDMSYLDAPDA